MSVTIKDIARESGYAVGTVSRVLNNHPDVSETARKKIMAVVDKYNFRINNNAKHLKQHASKAVAVIVKGSHNMLFAPIVEQLQSGIRQKGYDCLIYYINENENEVEQAVQVCVERRPVGILFLGSNHQYFLKQFGRINVPCVMVTNSASRLNFDNLSSVSTDDAAAAKAAIQHLIDAGHRKIGILGGYLEKSRAAITRFEGCKEAFKENNLEFDFNTDYQGALFSVTRGYEAMNRLLDRDSRLTAVFAMSDVMAIGAVRAITDRGLKVPQDISVIGFDGIEMIDYLVPKLATIRQNREEIARQSIEVLMQAVHGRTDAVHRVVPFKIITGESTKRLYSEENK